MIKCFLCPLNDMCPVPKTIVESSALPFKLNGLPDGAESRCPLYKAANEHGKETK